MKRFIEGADRGQSTLLPDCLDGWIDDDNPVRAVDVFVDGLDLNERGFGGVVAETTGRPSYHPSALLKLYIYGYLNRVQSSRRLEREAGRNLEVDEDQPPRIEATLMPPPAHASTRNVRSILLAGAHGFFLNDCRSTRLGPRPTWRRCVVGASAAGASKARCRTITGRP